MAENQCNKRVIGVKQLISPLTRQLVGGNLCHPGDAEELADDELPLGRTHLKHLGVGKWTNSSFEGPIFFQGLRLGVGKCNNSK